MTLAAWLAPLGLQGSNSRLLVMQGYNYTEVLSVPATTGANHQTYFVTVSTSIWLSRVGWVQRVYTSSRHSQPLIHEEVRVCGSDSDAPHIGVRLLGGHHMGL
jgi:hypothetical protein